MIKESDVDYYRFKVKSEALLLADIVLEPWCFPLTTSEKQAKKVLAMNRAYIKLLEVTCK